MLNMLHRLENTIGDTILVIISANCPDEGVNGVHIKFFTKLF